MTLKVGGLVETVVVSTQSTITIVLIVAESARGSIKMAKADEALFESIDMQFDKLYEENHRLRQCLSCALDYRPLPTDPLQLCVKERCQDVIEQWKKMRKE